MIRSKPAIGCRKTVSRSGINRTSYKWLLLLVAVAVVAIASSVLSIFSCAFFSYQEQDIADEEFILEGETAAVATVFYNPFEYFPRAGVGLFRYSMGDPTGNGILKKDPLCFSYCDEYTDYQWLSSNNKDPLDGTAHGNVDVWLVARYCSILAPGFGLLAVFLLTTTLPRCWRFRRVAAFSAGCCCWTVAALLQCGTFCVMLASPVMYSTSSDDQKQQFCRSGRFRCSLDAGGICSLASAVAYALLAVATALSWGNRGATPCASDHDTDESDDNDNDNENDEDGNEDDDEDDDDVESEVRGNASSGKVSESVCRVDSAASYESC